MTSRWMMVAAMIALAGGAGRAAGQVPFFTGTPTVVDPVIAVATSGVELNVERATVTSDRRYVTMDLDPQLSSLQGFRTFTFQSAGLGFVGGAAAAAANRLASTAPAPLGRKFTSALPPKPSPLDRPGLTLVSATP